MPAIISGLKKVKLNMTIFSIMILFYLIAPSYAENTTSVFDNKEGIYEGTVNGVLFIKTGDTEKTENPLAVINFQKDNAQLSVEHDEDEIYDSHFENYRAYSSKGKQVLKYSTYSNANGLWITVGDETYSISAIDGGCEYPVDGIKAVYRAHGDKEYLLVSFTKEVLLNNYWPRFHEKRSKGETYPSYRDASIKYARILKDSLLVFIIKGRPKV